jgi:nucleobase:cation symporter-1, NCS1 family
MLWKYKGPIYSSIGQDAQSQHAMGVLARINNFIEVDHRPVANKTERFLTKYLFLCVVSNDFSYDLDPVPVHRRLWGPWNFVAFWLADSININTWMIGTFG